MGKLILKNISKNLSVIIDNNLIVHPQTTINLNTDDEGTKYVTLSHYYGKESHAQDISTPFWKGYIVIKCNNPVKIDPEKEKVFYDDCEVPQCVGDACRITDNNKKEVSIFMIIFWILLIIIIIGLTVFYLKYRK